MSQSINNTGMYFREFTFEKGSVNREERTAGLSFSSEYPVLRSYGYEVLDHDQKSVRMDRVKNGLPVLINHNTDEQVGKGFNVDFQSPDRRGRALVRFSRSQRGEDALNDVEDGILTDTSFGYMVHKMVKDDRQIDGVDVYRAVDWEPFEISLLPVPADPTVGVGRSSAQVVNTVLEQLDESLEKSNENQEIEMENEVKAQERAPEINVDNIREEARKAEQTRVREILAMADKHNARELAQEFINSGKSHQEFGLALLDKRSDVKKVDASANLGMGEKEIKEFSFLRAINALVSGKRNLAPYEMEVSEACEKKMGRTARGFFVPMDVLSYRDLTKGSATAGGNLIGTSLLGGSFIEVLRNKMVLQKMGARIMDGLVGDLAIPSQTAATLGYWITEGSNITTEGAPTYGQATLIPKTVGAYVDISRKMMLQSTPAIEQLVRDDVATGLAIMIDTAGICGAAASNQPVGITQTGGIGSVVGGSDGLAPAWSHIVGLETEVAVDNADVGSLAYLTNAKVRGKLKQTFKNATYGEMPIWMDGSQSGVGMMNGYNAYVSNSVPSTLEKGGSGAVCSAIIFGNFSDMIIGFWGALDINIDTSTGGLAGTTRVIALQDADVAIRHAQSFAAMLDALTA